MQNIAPGMEVMLETFIHETQTMLDQLDEILLESERAGSLSEENINNIFRITHTIKGSSAMMSFDSMSSLSHSLEDVFFVIRDEPEKLDLVFNDLFDLMLTGSDALKEELEKICSSDEFEQGDHSELIGKLHNLTKILKNQAEPTSSQGSSEGGGDSDLSIPKGMDGFPYAIKVFFEDDCQMENMRAFMLISQLQNLCKRIASVPEHPENDSALCAEIIENGLLVLCDPIDEDEDEIVKCIDEFLNIKTYEVIDIEDSDDKKEEENSVDNSKASSTSKSVASPTTPQPKQPAPSAANAGNKVSTPSKQSLISVKQDKLDQLMDLVGEIVTAESMVASNPDLAGLRLDNFTKSIRELRKLTDELQDVVMSIRMVPLSGTFLKMERIVRDMCKKLDKKADLVTEGGDTEIDKSINDAIVDPFMHMIRNSMDHAIETTEERIAAGKSEVGEILLSAKNVGGEIHINIADDGKGLNPEKLLEKARQNGILTKPESEYTDKEIFGLIMLPGFSTKAAVTEFSGRGVGMDVVRKNIEQVGGTVSINSVLGQGTTFTIKIPLTLAIADGMNVTVGDTIFTLPIASISQSFKVTDKDQITQNADGSEMIMVRGECYPIIRLHRIFDIDTKVTDLTEGIIIQVENASHPACIFADNLLGEYQVVVKPFTPFFNKYNLKEKGLSGCSILGDGSISLILDSNSLINNN